MKKLIYLLILAFSLSSCVQQADYQPKKPKNIILMIGDGMGLTHVHAALTAKNNNLNIARCRYIGLVKTYSSDNYITDSGASGTAIATGVKTKNGAIGVDTSGIAQQSILEIAEEHGKATGLVATAFITHATPAAFIAHNPDRYDYENIALDFLKTDIDVFIGGGKNHFNLRSDSLNLIDSLSIRNYQIVYDLISLEKINSGKIAGLLYEEHPPPFSQGRADMLEKASLKAIEILNQEKNGFFLMIEGSQIDWAGHDNDNDYLIEETVDFDNTVGKVLDFAEKNGETLVIITADHETGGFAISDGNYEEGEVTGVFSSPDHTGVMVPLYAYGPGAVDFIGIYENTQIFDKMLKAFRFNKN